jgi:nucleotide-binding universal stress UspA family protein
MARKKKTLLVPIDGSDTSLRALRYACERFRTGGFDAVVALNAQVPMRASQFVTQEMIEEHHERLSEEALEPARKLAEKLDVKLTCAVANASPAEAIVNFVRKGDEIVMGTRGMGRVGNLLMGSVATRVIQLAEVPVTLVK